MTSLLSARVGGRVTQLVDVRRLDVVERAIPTVGAGEALVQITAFGICGTDLHTWAGRFMQFPVTLGHDAVGVVRELGPGTDGPAPGTRVVIDPMLSCDHCENCHSGLRHLCPNSSYLGMDGPGTMADYIVVPAHRIVVVPDAVSDEDATAVEPVTVALHLLRRVGPDAAGRPTEVVGGGPLGLLLAQTLQHHGHPVRVHELQEFRRALAERAGLDAVPAETDAVAAQVPALVVETSASAGGAQRAWDLASPGSIVAVIGRSPWSAPMADVLLREISVVGVRSGVDQYPAALELIAQGAARPTDVITHRFGLEQLSEAFEACADPDAQVMRSVVRL